MSAIRAFSPAGRVRFAKARNISEVLMVGIQAEILDADIAVDDVARADHILRISGLALVAPDAEKRTEREVESEIARVLPIVPDEIVDGGDAGRDDTLVEARADHVLPERAHSRE